MASVTARAKELSYTRNVTGPREPDDFAIRLLKTMRETIATEEANFADFCTRWPERVQVPDEKAFGVPEWLDERSARSAKFDDVYGFDDPRLAFEFKMRWV